jgi:hypothetical protein
MHTWLLTWPLDASTLSLSSTPAFSPMFYSSFLFVAVLGFELRASPEVDALSFGTPPVLMPVSGRAI